MSKIKAALTEKQVVSLWLQRMQSNRSLLDTLGNPVRVIYPGRSSDARGGDFRDALVDSGGSFHSGNIEIHTLNGNWLTHGHHKDPLYNNVILHVAFQSDRTVPTILQNGCVIPTVILDTYQPGPASRALPCQNVLYHLERSRLESLLKDYGLQRLAAKSTGLEAEMLSEPPEQVLYRGIFAAMGYSKNQEPFCRLAAALPFKKLQSLVGLASGNRSSIKLATACLLGSAGLLPSQRGLAPGASAPAVAYEEQWRRKAGNIKLAGCDWDLFKIRPANSPVRRAAALGCLAERLSHKGWLETLLTPLIFADLEKAAVNLISALEVDGDGYWSTHYDFGAGCRTSALIGKQRAAEIVVNVVLPFALAWSRRQGYPLLGKIEEVYCSFPALPCNSIERHMLEQLGAKGQVKLKACQQQGLLQIYKFGCTRGGCEECKLGVRS
jgi:hypothetical protein